MRTFYIIMFVLNISCSVGMFCTFLWKIVSGCIEDENFKKKSKDLTHAFVFLALFILFLLTSIAMGLNPWESVEFV